MIIRIQTISAAVLAALAAATAATSLVSAQSYPPSSGAVYSPYPPGSPADYRHGQRPQDFDALEDDEGPNAQSSTALPPPGPVLSPDDPRYGRPMGTPPVYSDRGPVMSPDDPRYGRPMVAPPVYSDRGPVLSPDDPRYGRRDDPPPVIYSDQPGGQPQQTYSDRGDNRRDSRPAGTANRPRRGAGSSAPRQATSPLRLPPRQPRRQH